MSGTWLAGTNRGVFSSTDVGIDKPPNFTPTKFNFDAVFSMDADKVSDVIYAGTLSDGLWISTDNTNFSKASISRPDPTVFTIGHDSGTTPTTILAGDEPIRVHRVQKHKPREPHLLHRRPGSTTSADR